MFSVSLVAPQACPRRLRLWAAWLVLALCFSGTLGQMHRMLHAPGLAQAQAGAQGHESGHGHGWLDGLFGIHGDAECRLYDQLSGDPALPGVPLMLLPLQLPAAQLLLRQGDFVARWAALFDARGPPRAPLPSF